jgi:hypothetical protein
VKAYILQLEAHLAETHRQAQRLIRKQTELGASLGDFGSSLLGLGKFEQPPLADQFLSMGEKSAVLAKNSQVSPSAMSHCLIGSRPVMDFQTAQRPVMDF